jgi:hypothetical protein
VFVLYPAGTGNGTLTYSVTPPGALGSGSRIRIEQNGAAVAEEPLSGPVSGETLSLAPGRYIVDILLVSNADGAKSAAYRELAVILSGITTELAFAPAEFRSPAQAAAPDLTSLVIGTTTANSAGIELWDSGALISAPNGTSTVYFTVTKPGSLSLTAKAGAEAVSAAEGSSAGAALAVFRVNTAAVSAAGGNIPVTLTAVADGREPADISLRVTVLAPGVGGGSILFAGGTPVGSAANLADALAWLQTGAADNTAYTVKLPADVTTGPIALTTASVANKAGVKITLTGQGVMRTITLNSAGAKGSLFAITGAAGKTLTLVLDNNVTLAGRADNDKALVTVNSYAVLEMKAGAKITGNTNIGNGSSTTGFGGGVLVSPTAGDAVFRMSGGEISGNTATRNTAGNLGGYGGGVCIYFPSGTAGSGLFEMSGGVIKDNAALTPMGQTPYAAYGGGVGIYGNESSSYAGRARFTLSGAGEIKNNRVGRDTSTPLKAATYTGYGAGVYVRGHFTMNGGSLSGNTGNVTGVMYGCGVYLTGRSASAVGEFVMSGGSITGNTSIGPGTVDGEGVYIGSFYTELTYFAGLIDPPVLVSIAVTRLPDKTVYYKEEMTDYTGLVVTGTYSDGSTRSEPVSLTPVMAGAGLSAGTGVKTIAISMGGLKISFTITSLG